MLVVFPSRKNAFFHNSTPFYYYYCFTMLYIYNRLLIHLLLLVLDSIFRKVGNFQHRQHGDVHVKRLITQFAPNYLHTLTAHPLPPSDSEGSKLYSQIFPCKNVGVTFTTLSNHLTDYPTLHSCPGLPTLQKLLFLKNTIADCRKANGI